MTRWITRSDATLAAVLCSVGSVLLLGGLEFFLGIEVVAVGMLVLSVIILTGHLETPSPIGWALAGASLLLLVANPVGAYLSDVLMQILHAAGGAILLALGVLKIAGTRPSTTRRRWKGADRRAIPRANDE